MGGVRCEEEGGVKAAEMRGEGGGMRERREEGWGGRGRGNRGGGIGVRVVRRGRECFPHHGTFQSF